MASHQSPERPGQDYEYKTSLDAASLKSAVADLNEDPNTRHIEVKALRERLERYPGLKACLNTPFLLRFLRTRKFNQEEAFRLVLNYYRIRIDDPDVFKALRPSAVRHVLEAGYSTALGMRDKEGAAVVLDRPGKWDYSRFSSLDLIKADIITVTKVVQDEKTQVYGITLIVDYQDFTFSHFIHNSTSFASRLCKLWQDVFPARLKCVHIVNEPSSFSSIFGIFKPFLKPKLLSRVRFHGREYKTLHEYIDPALLPEAYGGSQPDVDSTAWADSILSCEAEFEAESKYGFVDMVIDSGSRSDEWGVAGDKMAGTFKKLTVD